TNWNYFTMSEFKWDELMVGISLGVVGLLIALVQGVLIRYTTPKLGEYKSIYIGLALYAVGMLLFSFATEGWMMFVILIPYCLGGICGPALQSVISKNVAPNEQGELQGALTSLMSVTATIGPPLMTYLFYHFSEKNAAFRFPGAPFFLAFMLMSVSVVITYYAFKEKKS
ncbi:MFS transporter, partial [Chryseobacterium sp.]